MNIVILGAAGDVGSRMVAEALERDHQVTAVVRSERSLQALPDMAAGRVVDVLEQPQLLQEIVIEHDAVISALRPPSGQEAQLKALTRSVLRAAASLSRPIFVVGGAATLHLPDQPEQTVLSAPGFLPDSVRSIAEACAAQEAMLEEIACCFPEGQSRWVCLRPPAQLMPGPRTGRYAWGTDMLVVDGEGRSRISMEDFAMAMLDLVEGASVFGRKLTVGWDDAVHVSNGNTAV